MEFKRQAMLNQIFEDEKLIEPRKLLIDNLHSKHIKEDQFHLPQSLTQQKQGHQHYRTLSHHKDTNNPNSGSHKNANVQTNNLNA